MNYSHQDLREDLHEQMASLRHEVARLKKQLARRSRRAYRDTHHIREDLAEMLQHYYAALPDLRHGARRLQKSADAHPGTTAAIAAISVIVLGCAASLLLRR